MNERSGFDPVSVRSGLLLAISFLLFGLPPLAMAAPGPPTGPAGDGVTEGAARRAETTEHHRSQEHLTLDPKTAKLERQKAEDAEGEEEPPPRSPEASVGASTPAVSFGGQYVVKENEHHRGDLVLLGGSVDMRGDVTG